MGEYINIDGKNYVTENDYLDMVKFYENSLKKAYDEVKQLEEGIEGLRDENEKLKEDSDSYYWEKKYMDLADLYSEKVAENEKLKEEREFFYKSAKQFREQIEKWEKDFAEGRIVEKD